MKMTKRFLMATAVIASLGLIAGCGNIEPKEQAALTGPLQLTAENFTAKDATKTSVSGTTVQWVDGDAVDINDYSYNISVVGDKAYIADGIHISSAEFYGYYNCSVYQFKLTNHPGLRIPGGYDCTITADGRQVLALPMAVYSADNDGYLHFKHLTAAVNVLVWNATSTTLYIDKVKLTAQTYAISGESELNFKAEDYGMKPCPYLSTPDQPLDSVMFDPPMAIEPGEANARSIQVPIRPIGEDNLTIHIASHNAHYPGVSVASQTHTYEYTAAVPATARNEMITAKVKIDPNSERVTSSGVFTVNEAGDMVYFSQGNLQFCANTTGAQEPPYTQEWRFAETGLDFIDYYDQQSASYKWKGSESYDGWIDFFGYGTSGYDNGQTAYQPWSTDKENVSSENFPYLKTNLTGSKDWGYNAISNGGNKVNSGWRTPSASEWDYMINQRPGNRFAPAKIMHNGQYVYGYILLPDNWDTSIYPLTDINGIVGLETGAYESNTIDDDSVWTTVLAPNGAVFLAKNFLKRNGSDLQAASDGSYWTSSWGTPGSHEQPMLLNTYQLNPLQFNIHPSRCDEGYAVRLVRDANE